MKALVALAATALTVFALAAPASAATAPGGRWGGAHPNPRMFGAVHPGGSADTVAQAPKLAGSRALAAIGRW